MFNFLQICSLHSWSTGHHSHTLFVFYHMAIHMLIIKYPQITLCLWTFLQLPPGDLSRLKINFKTSEFLCLPGFHSKSLLALLYLLPHILYLVSDASIRSWNIFQHVEINCSTNNYKETFSKILKEHFSFVPLKILY